MFYEKIIKKITPEQWVKASLFPLDLIFYLGVMFFSILGLHDFMYFYANNNGSLHALLTISTLISVTSLLIILFLKFMLSSTVKLSVNIIFNVIIMEHLFFLIVFHLYNMYGDGIIILIVPVIVLISYILLRKTISSFVNKITYKSFKGI